MNLYLITQTVNNGYDTYDSAIVCAKDETAAKGFHPGSGEWDCSTWCATPDQVTVKLIGTAAPGRPEGVVLSSFNAG